MSDNKVKGPASYFPSIEKTYGQPIAHWQKIVRDGYPAKHMDLVAAANARMAWAMVMPMRSWPTPWPRTV